MLWRAGRIRRLGVRRFLIEGVAVFLLVAASAAVAADSAGCPLRFVDEPSGDPSHVV